MTEEPREFQTGIASVDAALSGPLQVGWLVVVAGAAARGKTSLALKLARNLAAQGAKVLFVSPETTVKHLLIRMMCAALGLRRCNIQLADFLEELDYFEFTSRQELEIGITLEDCEWPTQAQIFERIREARKAGGAEVVILDSLQGVQDRRRFMSNIAALARELKILIIVTIRAPRHRIELACRRRLAAPERSEGASRVFIMANGPLPGIRTDRRDVPIRVMGPGSEPLGWASVALTESMDVVDAGGLLNIDRDPNEAFFA